MPNNFFRFKQFTVEQEKCAMKVGTDGVLLGAWAELPQTGKILDIGTGTGLIALMAAQRSSCEIVGVDISKEACEQALYNVAASSWKNRITILEGDVKNIAQTYAETFDCIVSNPPFFTEKVKCPGELRNTARHTDSLTFIELCESTYRLLKPSGLFSVILPSSASSDFIANASSCHLNLYKQTWIHTKPNAIAKRVLMTFKKSQVIASDITHMTIHEADHSFSEAYKNLTSDFYLNC